MLLRRVLLLGVLTLLCYSSLYFAVDGPSGILHFCVVYVLGFTGCAFFVYHLRKKKWLVVGGNTLLWTIIAFGTLFRFLLVFHSPVASDDIYRYLWDGRVAAHGVNPFAYSPDDPRLSSLHTDDLPSKVNFPEMRTIYPPLAQGVFALSAFLGGDSLVLLKIILLICEVITMLLLVALLRQLRILQENVIIYAWLPLPILYFGLDGHIDALGIPFLLLFLLFCLKGYRVAGSFALGVAALSKVVPLIAAPFVFDRQRTWKSAALVVLPAALLVVGSLLYLEPTGGLTESFLVFGSSWEFNGAVFSLLRASGIGGSAARIICGVLLLIWMLLLMRIDRPLLEKVFLVFLGFAMLTPVLHPWYLSWLAALLALRWSAAVFTLLGLSVLSNLTVYSYRTTGIWEDQPVLLLLQYVPFAIVLAWEISHRRFTLSKQTVAQES